jgi:phosphatidylserine/phosphatidylglycerophosphate/cardiolipin synthase-like enzyme
VNTNSNVQETLDVLFSPSRQTEDSIVNFILSAKNSVHVSAYSFTSMPIAKALVKMHAQGLDVRVVMDKKAAQQKRSAAHFLAAQNIPVRLDAKYAIQHQKVIIVDGESVETGSYNFTKSARDKNSENVLIVRDDLNLAKTYEQNWEKLWNESDLIAPQ